MDVAGGGVEAVGRQVTRFDPAMCIWLVRRVLRRVRHRWRRPLRAETDDGLPRFVLAEFTEENYQVVWWIMASSALSLRFSLHLSEPLAIQSIFRRSAQPEPNTPAS